jgi:hypothetical protein
MADPLADPLVRAGTLLLIWLLAYIACRECREPPPGPPPPPPGGGVGW